MKASNFTLRYRTKAEGLFTLGPLSFELEPGKVYALIGPNGCGKSTLLRSISGVMNPGSVVRSGQVSWNSLSNSEQEADSVLLQRERVNIVGYLGADLQSGFALKVSDYLRLSEGVHLSSKINYSWKSILEQLCAKHLIDRTINTLSQGEQQLVLLARGLGKPVPYLFVDETLSKLDLNHQWISGNLIKKFSRDFNRCFVIVSHDLALATEWADSIIALKDGRLIAMGSKESLWNQNLIKELYPTEPVELVQLSQGECKSTFIQFRNRG